MIFINWYHYIVPKIFGAFSFIINPLFIFLIITRSKPRMGNYRYLLICFALFDISYSVAELLTPIAVINTGFGFATFLTDGPFTKNIEAGQHAVSSRCCFISLSYAILVVHFAYRYILLCKPNLVRKFFKPVDIIFILAYFFIHGASWSWVCDSCLAADDEIREMVRPAFQEDYNVNSSGVAMLTAHYMNASSYVVWKSWIGIGTLTITSMYCMTVYLVLGYKILDKMSFLKNTLSKTSLSMHQRLFKALVVQTCIPIFLSFLPTTIAWYAPIFGFNLSWWNNSVCIIALSAFPFIDPLAVICFIPSYKNAVTNFIKSKNKVKPQGSTPTSNFGITALTSKRSKIGIMESQL